MSQQTAALEAALAREIATACKALVLEVDRNLRIATPVRTGHARASWVPSVGAPSDALPDGSSDGAHSAGVAAVLAYTLGDGPLYVSTNVAYMPRLNGGSSSQAPAGFIEVAIDQAQATVNARYGVAIDVTSGIAASGAVNIAAAYAPEGVP